MAGRLRLSPSSWLLLAALLAVGSVVVWFLPSARWDWQPGLALRQPWRWWTAAFVHFSALHLGANLLGLLLVGLLGRAAGCGRRATLAWFVAWPLTHGALLLQPALAHYGGLSGLLHAGVAIVAWQLLATRGLLQRLVGVALLAGLALKLWLEAPWRGGPLRSVPGWDILIAPGAHLGGSLAGLLSAAFFIRR